MQPVAQTPFLSDAEVADACQPLQRPAAQRKYLEQLGLMVKAKPNGRPLVARSEVERVLGAGRFAKAQNDASSEPNVIGMLEHLAKRKKNGPKTQGR